MVARVSFTADQSKKYIRITDLLKTDAKPKTSGLLEAGDDYTVNLETADGKTGLVKVEVSRDGEKFAIHYREKEVEDEKNYPIDDSYLP